VRVARFGWVLASTSAACVAGACGPTTVSVSQPAPINICPDAPCAAYAQRGVPPTCSEGACLVAAQFPSNLILVVSLAQDSYLAPGRTYVVPFSDLHPAEVGNAKCPAGFCANLDKVAVVRGAYTVLPDTAAGPLGLNYQLNPNGVTTTLPVRVTYRLLWPPGATSAQADAFAAGLPVEPVSTDTVVNDFLNIPGPGLGPSLVFWTYLQPGTYERTVVPQAPFDRVFPPDVNVIGIPSGSSAVVPDQMVLDVTSSEGLPLAMPVHPTFTLTRAAGLDGWTAFLRDLTTGRPLSNVAPLAGTTAANVVLATNHHPPPPNYDALTNAELVMKPPAGLPIPTGKFQAIGDRNQASQELDSNQTYLPIPEAVLVQGAVTGSDEVPVEADLVFEAIGIDARPPNQADFTLYKAGPNTNFEYTASGRTNFDGTGASTYSITLPCGEYRVVVRPTDASHGVTSIGSILVRPPPYPPTQSIPLSMIVVKEPVHGQAFVADRRPLAEAIVDALPALCADTSTAAECMPRAGRTRAGLDGSFDLTLDPGTYVLRVRPLDGTRLPWWTLPTLIGPVGVDVGSVYVPAPQYAGLTLHDDTNNAIVNALVRVYQLPTPGSAGVTPALKQWVEIGEAITDSTGHYDMYLAPAAQ
jgi:hypothetical protein